MPDDQHDDVVITGTGPGGPAQEHADISFFPSIGAVNPSLTAIANALRVGDHFAERLG